MKCAPFGCNKHVEWLSIGISHKPPHIYMIIDWTHKTVSH